MHIIIIDWKIVQNLLFVLEDSIWFYLQPFIKKKAIMYEIFEFKLEVQLKLIDNSLV